MNELSGFVFLLFLLLIVVVVFGVRQMANFRRKTALTVERNEAQLERLRSSFFTTLSEVMFSDALEQSTFCIATGIRRAFDAHAFIFRRKDKSAELAAYSNGNSEELSTLLLRAGLKLDVYRIGLSRERDRVFDADYAEYDSPFPLIGDLTTSAACRKLQHELGFARLAFSSVETDDGDYAVLVLLPDKRQDVKRGLSQFALLIKYATYLASLKKKLRALENRFDEQLVQVKYELARKESVHFLLFDGMPIPAAMLDDRGVITEANRGLVALFADESKTVGQPLSSIVGEEERRDFIEFLVNLPAGESGEIEFQNSGKNYTARVVSLRNAEGKRAGYVAYLIDRTSETNLERELGRTIDALRAENEKMNALLSEERKYSEETVRNAEVAILAVSGETVSLVSEGAKRLFETRDGQGLNEFLSENSIPAISSHDSVFEVPSSENRKFSVTTWATGSYRFYVFTDITSLRSAEEQLDKSKADFENVFNSALPTALLKEEKFVQWNEGFENLFQSFLSGGPGGEKTLDAFLLHLGESPEVFKSELRYNNRVARTCRTVDRRFLGLTVVGSHDSNFVFVQNLTDEENAKQRFRSAQGLLTSSLESFSEEPIFIVENNMVSAANLAARNKLGIRLDETFNEESFTSKILVGGAERPIDLDGQFYRLETAAMGSLKVYRLRLVNEEVRRQREIDRLTARQETLRRVSMSDAYEGILQALHELIKTDGVESARLLSAGIMQTGKGSAEVYLLNVSSGKVEPPLSLSLLPVDVSTANAGGFLTREELPNSTFMNVISAGESSLVLKAISRGDISGFAAVALREGSSSDPSVAELEKVLKAASSATVGIYAGMTAERKFEESGRVVDGLAGLAAIAEGPFEEVAGKTNELLKRVFGSNSSGVYSAKGSMLTSLALSGDLPASVPAPGLKFGFLAPMSQLASQHQMKAHEGSYIAARSRSGNLVFIAGFSAALPAAADLSAFLSAAIEVLDAKRQAEVESIISAQLREDSRMMSDFMAMLAGASGANQVIEILNKTLSNRHKDVEVAVSTEREAGAADTPLGIVEKEDGEFAVYEANFIGFGVGIIRVKCQKDRLSRSMVELAFDKVKSILTMRLPALQNEAADLLSKLEGARDDYSRLKDTVEKIPSSLRNARIEIDGALSRLSFLQGEERVMQEIRLRLASAAKEISVDLDSSMRNQDELFQAVRAAVMEHVDEAASVRNFDVSVLAEVRIDPATFDLVKDLLVNFIITSGIPDCEVLMKTTQPAQSEVPEGKGRHLIIALSGEEGGIPTGSAADTRGSIQPLIEKLEKLGYLVTVAAHDSELTMDVCEIRPVEAVGQQRQSAILVEDDRQLAEEETQTLLQAFSRLKVATDAVEATELFEAETFGVAFVDLSLPSINGRELCRQMKQAQPGCVTVLLTNREGEEKSEGVDHIALRPIILEAVKSYLPNPST